MVKFMDGILAGGIMQIGRRNAAGVALKVVGRGPSKMSEEIEPNAIDVELFDAIEGSQSSADGQGFALHARRRDGSGVMLVFPHSEISNIIETAAMLMDHGRDDAGQAAKTAFNTSSFKIGRGPVGQPILTLVVGERGNISFLLPSDMARQLFQALGRVLVHQ